ncbi:transposase [Paraburkholderia kururiensis]|uniref:IS66-like element accessory protein TnpA n=1 Tax=Paraburkholderia kururiensis TaxID=984307 RepID=UPI000AE785E3|nr:transposase [Paraburkholderia kururiensis]
MDRLDEVVTAARKRPNFAPEFRQSIVEMTLRPGACVAQIAREHGLNDNMVFKWRRRFLDAQAKAAESVPALTSVAQSTDNVMILPVNITDAPAPTAAERQPGGAAASCEVEIEVGKRRVRICGLSMDLAERFLRDCLK